jgi:hypothetical protein
MNCSISDEVPTGWDDIIDCFLTMAEWESEFNQGSPVENVTFQVHKGLLKIDYSGGNHITDAYARFAREMSAKICYTCGVPATRVVFQYPKCDECE